MAAGPGVEGPPTAGRGVPTVSELISGGRLDDAAALLERHTARNFSVLASLRHRLGDLRAAVAAYRASLDLEDSAATQASLAFVLCEAGSLAEAARHARRSVDMDGSSPFGLLAAATVELARRRYPDALEFLRLAEALRPDDVSILVQRAALLRQADRLEEAAAACRRALDLEPDHPGAWRERGLLAIALDRDDEARAALEGAETRSPRPGRVIADQAILGIQNGEPENGGFARALTLAGPSDVVSILYDRAITARLGDDPAVDVMEQRLGVTQRWMEKVQLHYALAHVHLGERRFEKAFLHLHAASPMVRASFDYCVHDDERRMLALAEAFPQGSMASEGSATGRSPADLAEAPIFVVGMPRSGTSLVEQILASHPDIHAIGEPALVASLFRTSDEAGAPGLAERVNALSQEEVRALGRSYLRFARQRAGNDRRTVDKRTDNFLHMGLINLMLPQARIINCRRDPMDVGLSCYSRLFTTGHEFSYVLREIGLYHRAYDGLMAHWRGLLPSSRLLEVEYEALVAEPAGNIRRMLDFCGLAWNDACLRFFETKRPVRFFFIYKVRSEIYTHGVGRWKSCESFLEPLRTALAG